MKSNCYLGVGPQTYPGTCCQGREVNAYIGVKVLTAMVMQNSIFWVTTPCSLLKVNRSFGETRQTLLAICLHTCLLFGLSFDPEGGENMFLRNVGRLISQKTELFK
jgi:hypothetical protein